MQSFPLFTVIVILVFSCGITQAQSGCNLCDSCPAPPYSCHLPGDFCNCYCRLDVHKCSGYNLGFNPCGAKRSLELERRASDAIVAYNVELQQNVSIGDNFPVLVLPELPTGCMRINGYVSCPPNVITRAVALASLRTYPKRWIEQQST